LGHNTDAFDVGNSDDITITGATVYNQDDCLAVNSGTNIQFLNNYCSVCAHLPDGLWQIDLTSARADMEFPSAALVGEVITWSIP